MRYSVVSKDTFTVVVPKEIVDHKNFKKWLEKTDNSQLLKVEAVREKIENHGIITNAKNLKDGLYERKWRNGLRLYFAIIEEVDGRKTLLLLGSGKDREQDKAILIAKTILENFRVVKEEIKFKEDL